MSSEFPRKYYCDCSTHCKLRKEVSRTTFYSHSRFRDDDNPEPMPLPARREPYSSYKYDPQEPCIAAKQPQDALFGQSWTQNLQSMMHERRPLRESPPDDVERSNQIRPTPPLPRPGSTSSDTFKRDCTPRFAHTFASDYERKPLAFAPGPRVHTPVNPVVIPPVIPPMILPFQMPPNTAILTQAMSKASHEDLMLSHNRAYTELYFSYLRLESEFRVLKQSNAAFIDTLQHANISNPLAHRSTGASMLLLPTAPQMQREIPNMSLRRSDYPHVKSWYRQEWEAREKASKAAASSLHNTQPLRGNVRAARGENVTMRYVEDIYGVAVDGFRASEIRRIAREVWSGMRARGTAPRTWMKVDMVGRAEYRGEMRERVPELRLCDGDWKAERIAVDCYPSWYKHNVRPDGEGGKENREEEEEMEAAENGRLRSKRQALTPPLSSEKRFRAAGHATMFSTAAYSTATSSAATSSSTTMSPRAIGATMRETVW